MTEFSQQDIVHYYAGTPESMNDFGYSYGVLLTTAFTTFIKILDIFSVTQVNIDPAGVTLATSEELNIAIRFEAQNWTVQTLADTRINSIDWASYNTIVSSEVARIEFHNDQKTMVETTFITTFL